MNMREAEKMALRYFKEHGEQRHPEIIMVHANGEKSLHTVVFDNDESKEEAIKFYRSVVTTKNVKKYFVIMEAWITFSGNIYVRPSENKNRKEVLMISEYRNDMYSRIVYHLFHKEGKNVIFDDRKEIVHDGNDVRNVSIWNFYTEDVMGEVIEKERFDEFIKMVGGKEKFEEKIKILVDIGTRVMKLDNDEDKEKLRETAIKMIREGRVVPTDKAKDRIDGKDKESG